MVIFLYRWKLKPDKVEQFASNWAKVTLGLRENCNSLGSRLHKGDDGLYYGYAQWPNLLTRENAKLETEEIKKARLQMRDAIEESLPDTILEPLLDYLISK